MEPLDLKKFEWKTAVRPLTIDDFDELIAMAKACFPGMETWSRDQIESQLEIFPEGQLCVEIEGRLAASSSSLILEYDASLEWHNWKAVADAGFIRNHKPKGDTLYGIEIMVHPGFPWHEAIPPTVRRSQSSSVGKKTSSGSSSPAASRVFTNTQMRFRPPSISIGFRKKRSTTRCLTAQLSNGFAVKGLIPNYLPSDVES